MEPRMRHIIGYIQEHEKQYKKEALVATLKQHGYTSEEIDEAYGILSDGGMRDSFFSYEPLPREKKAKPSYGLIALSLCIVPIAGGIIAYILSKKINAQTLPGRELAFFALLINIAITTFAALFLLKLLL